MSRYFTRTKAAKPKAEWDDDWGLIMPFGIPSVPEHEATDTGLLDRRGDCIMRAQNPMGFGRDDEL